MSELRISHETLKRFALDLIQASGLDAEEADIIADVFIWMDMIGRYTQGIARLPVYLKRFQLGLINSPCHPEFVKRAEAVYLLEGNDGFGHYLGHLAMKKAVDIARRFGVGLVGVKHSNHFGAAAYYVNLAAQDGQIGMAVSNSVPHVAAHGGISAVLGTNPMAISVPTKGGYPVLIDLSTGPSSGSAIMKAAQEGKQIPSGWVIDHEGNPVVDAKEAVQGVLLPFGGAKGFCLCLAVEILSGVLTGSAISNEIASLHKDFSRSSRVGHSFLAIDVTKMMPAELFYGRMDTLIGFIKGSRKQKGIDEILIPGETRWRCYQEQHSHGISLDEKAMKSLAEFAKDMKISPPW
ncbi:MAG: Ldh family oxidoreductase [Candidatus Aminicenantales bacterium]